MHDDGDESSSEHQAEQDTTDESESTVDQSLSELIEDTFERCPNCERYFQAGIYHSCTAGSGRSKQTPSDEYERRRQADTHPGDQLVVVIRSGSNSRRAYHRPQIEGGNEATTDRDTLLRPLTPIEHCTAACQREDARWQAQTRDGAKRSYHYPCKYCYPGIHEESESETDGDGDG